jgi:hypothetical protein
MLIDPANGDSLLKQGLPSQIMGSLMDEAYGWSGI